MASFISTNETLERRQNGVVSRTGGKIINRVVEVSAGLNAGVLVCPSGTAGIACDQVDSAADVAKALGFTVFRPMSYDADLTDGSPHYAENEVGCILEEGYMFVLAEGTVVAEAPVYARITSDGGSNTTLGKVRADNDYAAGLTITPASSGLVTAQGAYVVRLVDAAGNDETFAATGDGTLTVNELATSLKNLIDASPNFAATDNTGSLTVTATAGGVIDVLQLGEHLTVTAGPRAVRVPNAYFAESRSGAGLVEIRVGAPNR